MVVVPQGVVASMERAPDDGAHAQHRGHPELAAESRRRRRAGRRRYTVSHSLTCVLVLFATSSDCTLYRCMHGTVLRYSKPCSWPHASRCACCHDAASQPAGGHITYGTRTVYASTLAAAHMYICHNMAGQPRARRGLRSCRAFAHARARACVQKPRSRGARGRWRYLCTHQPSCTPRGPWLCVRACYAWPVFARMYGAVHSCACGVQAASYASARPLHM